MPASINFVRLLSLVAVVNLPPAAATEGFLTGYSEVVQRGRIVDQLRSVLGYGRTSGRRAVIEELLRPTFMALPRDSRGSLGHRAARYALHRYFSVEHGWHIKGLSLEIPENRTSPPTAILKSRMPSFIMQLLEEQIGSGRVALDELVVLASTIEDLVHGDVTDLLYLAYETHGLSTDVPLDAGQADLLIRTFMLYFRFPWSQSYVHREGYIMQMLSEQFVYQMYPQIDDDMLWVEDVRQDLVYQDRSYLRPSFGVVEQHLDFSSAASWARAIVSGYGTFTNLECSWIKNTLMESGGGELEDGRLPLGKFYESSLALDNVGFTESPAYLRHLGVLDEHNQRQPSIIVPNMVYAVSSCIATSGVLSVCCIDSCEVLMADLERKVSQPAASPALIASVVSAMPSDTVAAPRNLPASLLSRLDEIAGRHGGSVRLHSRLFSQWMHYAFPNECTYPRSLLTSEVQLGIDEWAEQTKIDPDASEEEKKSAMELCEQHELLVASEGPTQLWSEDEEFLSDLVVAPGHDTSSYLLSVLAFAVAISVSASAVRKALRAGRGHGLEKSRTHKV